MDPKVRDDELYEAYVKAQKLLWEQWMEIARQFEVTTGPEDAWWSIQYRALDEQMQNNPNTGDPNKAWLQLWSDGLDQRKGILAAMVEWNQRIIEHRAEANKRFLAAWSEVVRKLGGERWDRSTQQAFEALQNSLHKTLAIPYDLSPMPIKQEKIPVTKAKRSAEAAQKIA